MIKEENKRLSRSDAKAKTRVALIAAARTVFAKRGFHAASLDQIAEAAGYTKGAIYSHFKSKDDLYLALLDDHLNQVQTSVETAIEAGTSFSAIEKQLQDDFFQELTEQREWAILTVEFFSHALRDEVIKERLALRIRQAIADVEKSMCGREKALGKKLSLPPDELAVVMLAFINGLDLWSLIDSDPRYAQIYARFLTFMLD